jgi:protein lifeguard
MFGYQKAPDLEAGLGGSTALYPGMTESPDLRWAFVRKIYVQLAMTAAVSAFVVKVPAVSQFFVSSNAGIALYIFLIILPFLGQLRPALLTNPPSIFFSFGFASYFRS